MPLSPPSVFRFAPSPNGRLHLGHAYSALLNAQLAEKLKGRFLVRLEDIDTTRCTGELAEQCLKDLAWLGLAWEKPVRVQSQHWEDYARALNRLKERGLIYPCFCTRRDVTQASQARDPDGAALYPGTCAALARPEAETRIATGEPHAWRLQMNKALRAAPGKYRYRRFLPDSMQTEEVIAHPARWGDAILARKEIPTSYHLAVVVDDALQQVSHVVRGADLEAATCLHALLQALLGLPVPLYYHHPLITEPDGEKLSKSRKNETLADLRAREVSPAGIRKMLGF